MVNTRSHITPTSMNRFGCDRQYSEYIVWGWPWQILGVIRAKARMGERAKIFL